VLSRDNPNRDRNYVLLILAAVVVVGVVMGAYVTLDLAGRDSAAYARWVTLLIVTGVPGMLAAWKSYTGERVAREAVVKVAELGEVVLNGNLEPRITESVHVALDERGAPGGRPDGAEHGAEHGAVTR